NAAPDSYGPALFRYGGSGPALSSRAISLAWEQPTVESAEDRGTDMAAAPLNQLPKRPYLLIRLVRGIPASAVPGALGYFLPFAANGTYVIMFGDRVETLARERITPPKRSV